MNISNLCIRSSRILYKKQFEGLLKCQANTSTRGSTPSSNIFTANSGTLVPMRPLLTLLVRPIPVQDRYVFKSAVPIPDESEKNPTPIFFSDKVQSLLKELTAVNLQKVFQHRRDQQKLKPPAYQFMTTEEVEQATNEAKEQAEERLQMPPVLLPRAPIDCELAKDPALQGYSTSNFVFTDITYGIQNRDRLIVVRDTDGTLRKASWEERDKINQIYFPQSGRNWKTPKMFEPEYLQSLLERGEYEFILDRTCLQFEPDDLQYISVAHQVYEHLDEKRSFEKLKSTRHFGPLAFYLAWNHKIDNLVLDGIQNDRIKDAVTAIELLHHIHPNLKSAAASVDKNEPLKFIKEYIAVDSKKRSSLELALQSYEEMSSQRQQLAQGLEKAHGHN